MQSTVNHHASLLEPVPVAARVQVQELLEDILRSVPFRTSRQCQDLFRYVVEHSLTGSDETLRERVIGIEVFGRAPDYDTADDPVVRLRAADVRKRLAQYYQLPKNESGHWKIEIPTGSYKAQFHPSETALPESPAPPPTLIAAPAEPLPSRRVEMFVQARPNKRKRLWMLALLAGILAALLAALTLTHSASPVESAFDLFWEPILKNPKPVLVFTGSNPVYNLSMSALSRYKATHPQQLQDATPNLQSLVPLEDLKQFTAQDFVPIKDTYLTTGDAWAAAQISSLLSSHNHAFDLRFANDLSFGDLRVGPAISIGAFSNSWTLKMTDNLRFVFDGADTPEMHIQDRFDLSRSWRPKISHGQVTEEYAIISRVLDSKTGNFLITIAGLNHSGSRAAAQFATNPQLLAELVKQAPKNWSKSNMQVVLHTDVVNDIPGTPTVVAAHYW